MTIAIAGIGIIQMRGNIKSTETDINTSDVYKDKT